MNRIVHFGPGAFHRAHQAVFTELANAAGTEHAWQITGVSPRSAGVRDRLAAQEFAYHVWERAPAHSEAQRIHCIGNVLAPTDGESAAVLQAVSDPATQIVSLTITEKGYYRSTQGPQIDLADPAVHADLGAAVPATVPVMLIRGLQARKQRAAGPLTLLSCDNLPQNGSALRGVLLSLADAMAPELRSWLEDQVRFPNSMVDRIVPATTDALIDEYAAEFGRRDAALVVTEPFRQWVVEDNFAAGRPAWEVAGVQFSTQVEGFEQTKLRVLNGAHSALAMLGLGLQQDFIHEALAQPEVRRFVDALLGDEILPHLPRVTGLDAADYQVSVLERFANPYIPYRCAQVASDSSQKLPQRLLCTLAERLEAGGAAPRLHVVVAAWLAHIRRCGTEANLNDPLAAELREAAQLAGVERVRTTLALLPDTERLLTKDAVLTAIADELVAIERAPDGLRTRLAAY